jgi:hypothetical protein
LCSWLCVIWGGLCLASSLWGTWYTVSLLSHSVVIDAVISDISEGQDQSGNKTSAPVATYTDDKQDIYRTRPHEVEFMSAPYAQIGEHVRVLYDKASPSDGMIYSYVEFWGVVLRHGLAGLVWCALGVSGVWMIKLKRRRLR